MFAATRMTLFSAAFHPTGWWLAQRLGAQRVGENEASWRYALRGLSPAQAAAGLRTLPDLDAINAWRRMRGEQIASALRGLPGVHLPSHALLSSEGTLGDEESTAWTEDVVEPIYLRFPVLFESEGCREQVLQSLNAAGIGAGRMYRKSLAQYFPSCADGIYPGAEQVARRLLTLPTHHYVTDRDVSRMADAIAGAVRPQAGGGAFGGLASTK